MNKNILTIFWVLVGFFLIILGQFFVPALTDVLSGSELFLIPMIVFCILGGILVVLVFKSKTTGWLRKFLMLTGLGSTGFFVGVFLHNAFYALAIVSEKIIVLKYLFEFLHVSFFLISIIVCPLAFLVGVIGSIVIMLRKK